MKNWCRESHLCWGTPAGSPHTSPRAEVRLPDFDERLSKVTSSLLSKVPFPQSQKNPVGLAGQPHLLGSPTSGLLYYKCVKIESTHRETEAASMTIEP